MKEVGDVTGHMAITLRPVHFMILASDHFNNPVNRMLLFARINPFSTMADEKINPAAKP